MTGREKKNRPEFERVQEMLCNAGHDARIPHEFDEAVFADTMLVWSPRVGAPWQDWMWFCMHFLSVWRPDGAVFLYDWPQSPGASAEALWFKALRNGAGKSGPRMFINQNNTFHEVGEGPNGELGDKRIWVYRPEVQGLVEMPQPHLGAPDLDFGLVAGKRADVRWDSGVPDSPAGIDAV
jgi:hypothetical protein